MDNVIITTGDIRKNYEVIAPVCYEYVDTNDNWENAFQACMKTLKRRCKRMEGDAVIYLMQNTESFFDKRDNKQHSKIRFCGTVIKLVD